jgi:uncharacterized integral membrane protein
MRKFLTALILVPIAIAILIFAVANRQTVAVSFDPFDQVNPAFTLALPLFALLLAVAIGGVVIGGMAAWVRQSKWRRAARLAQARARELDAELTRLKQEAGLAEPRTELAPKDLAHKDLARTDRAPKDIAPRYAPQLTIAPPAR